MSFVALLMIGAVPVEAQPAYPPAIRAVLDNTKPLQYPRGNRLPLLLWPVHGGVVDDPVLQERIVTELNQRGVAMIALWDPSRPKQSLARSLRIARIQTKLGLDVYVNANACMYGFFDGDESTAHLDRQGKPFFETSISGGKIGCPFRIGPRYSVVTEQIDQFVRAYRRARVPLDFVFGDWEIDGPLEINRAWESAKRCMVCQKAIPEIEDFRAFQEAVRQKRAEATSTCYVKPILSRYPSALVGNYGVYAHDGYRYWFDYFEDFVAYHPHRLDQRAPCRQWFHEFPLTGYTLAMPVVYPWSRIYGWYDFDVPDYRWFYNMLLVASNACKHSDRSVPIVPFVHWNTVFDPRPRDDSVPQMSRHAYQELLWHMLLRGADTFFMWCPNSQVSTETALVHQVWSEGLRYADWLQEGEPVTFDVRSTPRPVVSGLRRGTQVLVRRTDFDDRYPGPIDLAIDGNVVSVPRSPGRCLVLTIGE